VTPSLVEAFQAFLVEAFHFSILDARFVYTCRLSGKNLGMIGHFFWLGALKNRAERDFEMRQLSGDFRKKNVFRRRKYRNLSLR